MLVFIETPSSDCFVHTYSVNQEACRIWAELCGGAYRTKRLQVHETGNVTHRVIQ